MTTPLETKPASALDARGAVAAARRYAAPPLSRAARCPALRALGELLRSRPEPLVNLLAEEVNINFPVALLQTAIFTSDQSAAMQAVDELREGGVVVNETSWRCMPAPFEGVGESGFGRDGTRCAIEAATTQRTTVLSP